MLLFYFDALVLLIGAQINSEIDFDILKVPRGTRNFRTAEQRAGIAPPGADDGEIGEDGNDASADAVRSHGAD
jgi:hypothetical protein